MCKKLIVCMLFCLGFVCSILVLTGCDNSTRNFDDKVKVIYRLEGVIYQNCEDPVIQYDDFDEGTSNLIIDLSELSGQAIVRTGYTLEGWYTKKTGEGSNAIYEDKWDFENDKVTSDGITLYAKWKKNILYAYEVCYRDETDGSVHSLGSYEVNEGDRFNDYYASYFGNKRYGYTALAGLYTENDEPWDESFTHPGGEVDTAVRVFLQQEC